MKIGNHRIPAITITVILSMAILTVPALAALDIKAVHIDYDAAENQPALLIERTGKPDVRMNAGEFILKGNIKTIAGLEEYITGEVNEFIVEETPLSQFPTDDPVRQDPPELAPNEIIVGNKLQVWTQFFAIHIFSLDDPETPESELYFWTRFQSGQAGPILPGWWQ